MASVSLCAGTFSGVDSVGVGYNDSGAERFMTRTEAGSIGTVLTSGCSSCRHSPDKLAWWFTAKHDTEIDFKVDCWGGYELSAIEYEGCVTVPGPDGQNLVSSHRLLCYDWLNA